MEYEKNEIDLKMRALNVWSDSPGTYNIRGIPLRTFLFQTKQTNAPVATLAITANILCTTEQQTVDGHKTTRTQSPYIFAQSDYIHSGGDTRSEARRFI